MEGEFVKPECQLVGTDGNIFALIGKASGALKKAGYREQADEMCSEVMQCGSYEEALSVITDYVDAS